MTLIKNIIRNTMKRTLAIPAALAAIPPNPKTPAISARIRKLSDQDNILILRIEKLVKIENNRSFKCDISKGRSVSRKSTKDGS